MQKKASYSELSVHDVTVKVGQKTILQDIELQAKSGELLAILGPTGSGKTTILNVVSGRLKPTTGQVMFNGDNFGKRLRRKLAFVQQQDVFFSQLTLWETLYFTATIRLPDSMAETEKRQKIDEIVESLDLKKCLNTVIGDIFVRGLSGGEKKRASIACELLTDPDILLMDEPTSGLDSSTALTLMQKMQEYAKSNNKMIITTIHQPSSQIYHLFNNILLLINGQEAYYGPGRSALRFFEELGFVCESHFNPADFILQMAKSDERTVDRILSCSKDRRCRTASEYQDQAQETVTDTKQAHSDHIHLQDLSNNVQKEGDIITKVQDGNGNNNTRFVLERETQDVTSSLLQITDDDMQGAGGGSARWPTSWWTQYYMLSWRSFKQTKGILLQGYSIIQCTVTALLVGVMYWQIEQTLETIRDVMGLLFFAVSYWTFNAAFEAITLYPAEKAVVSKERAAGSYRLTAYYLCKITSDLPLSLLLPTLMYSIMFIMSGVGGVAQFFMSWPVILLQVLLSQGFGFAISVAFNGEVKPAFTTFVTYTLCAFMVGGFFTQQVPSWFTWARYLSTIMYPFSVLSYIIFSQYQPIACGNTTAINFPQCASNTTNVVYYKDILTNAGIVLPIHLYIFPIFLFIIVFRLIGYVLLKYQKPKML